MGRLGILLLLFGLGACADVPLASRELDAVGKRFDLPRAGYATLYIFRDGGLFSSSIQVTLNAQKIGTLGSNTWLRIDVLPGTYDVRGDAGSAYATTTVRVPSSENRFIMFTTNIVDLTFAGNFFSLLATQEPESTARSAILKMRRVLLAD